MRYYNWVQFLAYLSILSMFMTVSCEEPTPKDLGNEALIPKPVSLQATGSSFAIKKDSRIYVQGGDEELMKTANYLAEILRPATGFPLEVGTSDSWPSSGNLFLSLESSDAELGTEGYQLDITEDLLVLKANAVSGIFRGIQTLRQLLPASIEAKEKQTGPWEIGSGTIKDYPRFGYRGAMLDVARHFFSVDEVKTFIDYIASYKLNTLHLHLSDDQGWRIEIKSWPKLAEVGGSSEVGGGEGGFFTQEEYKDIVAYAADRYITVIPEIDMPGHTNAILASYPELYCSGRKPEIYTGIEVGFSTLCTSNEKTYEFVDDVIRELAAITPGEYLHIGGDETHATELKDYIPFVNRVQDIVLKHGKLVMGWDEIAQATLKKNTIAQYWDSKENAEKALKQNAKILVSPAKNIYLDMSYDTTSKYGLHWAAYIEIDSSYQWDPEALVEGMTADNILGIESPLWSETVSNMHEAEWLIFPRLPGHAEIGWSPRDNRSWDEYRIRLGRQKARFDVLGINYYPSKQIPWAE